MFLVNDMWSSADIPVWYEYADSVGSYLICFTIGLIGQSFFCEK